MHGGIGVTKMKTQPILPVGIMIAVFAVLFAATAIVIIRNKLNTWDKIFTLFRMSLIYLFAFIIGMRPVHTYTNYEFATKNLDVLFVVDTTMSMWANDYNGNHIRMDGVKKDVDYILNELSGSNFGLIAFDDTARVLSPFTQDMMYISDLFDLMEMPESYYASGSDMGIPYRDLSSLLESSAKKENRKTIVFFISDGEITNGKPMGSYADLAKYVDAGAVLGYGSEAGGRMKEKYGFVYDYNTHNDAVSRIDVNNLRQIAADLGVQYIDMNGGNEPLLGVVEIVKQSSATIVEQGTGAEKYNDLYFYFSGILFFLVLIEVIFFIRRGRL